MPSGKKPLPEPMLSQIYAAICYYCATMSFSMQHESHAKLNRYLLCWNCYYGNKKYLYWIITIYRIWNTIVINMTKSYLKYFWCYNFIDDELPLVSVMAWCWLVKNCSLKWCHNGHDSVSNHQPHYCLLNHCRPRWKKHQSSRPLAFVRGIRRGSLNSPHKWPVTRNFFPFDDVIMC